MGSANRGSFNDAVSGSGNAKHCIRIDARDPSLSLSDAIVGVAHIRNYGWQNQILVGYGEQDRTGYGREHD
jgi:hypothetical protein